MKPLLALLLLFALAASTHAAQLDILPTVLAAVGVEPKADWKLDGVNLLPHLSGPTKTAPHDLLYWRFGQQMAVRKGDWKLVKYDAVADGGKGTSPQRLYNLADDIGEKTDMAAKKPEKVKELQATWDRWNEGNVAARWGAGKQKD